MPARRAATRREEAASSSASMPTTFIVDSQSTTSLAPRPHEKPSAGRVRLTISTRYSPGTRDGRPLISTLSATFRVSRFTPACASWPVPPHSTAHRCETPWHRAHRYVPTSAGSGTRTGRSCLRARSTWWSRTWRCTSDERTSSWPQRRGGGNQEQLAHRFFSQSHAGSRQPDPGLPRRSHGGSGNRPAGPKWSLASLVHRLDEHARRPGPGRRAVAPVEIQRRTRRLDLIESLYPAS